MCSATKTDLNLSFRLRSPGAREAWIQCDISASTQGAAGGRWCSDEVGDSLSSQHPAGW